MRRPFSKAWNCRTMSADYIKIIKTMTLMRERVPHRIQYSFNIAADYKFMKSYAFRLIKFFKQFMTRKHVTLNVPLIRRIRVFTHNYFRWLKKWEHKNNNVNMCRVECRRWVGKLVNLHMYAKRESRMCPRRGYLFAITFQLTRASVLVWALLSWRRFAFFHGWRWRRHTSP